MDSISSPEPRLDDLTVIVVTYNSAHCLPMLAKALTMVAKVIIVDNGSNDDSAGVSARLLPHAVLIANERNLGFGAANNQALARVSTPFALALNPDTVPDLDFLLQMVEAAESYPDAAIIAPQLLKKDKKPEVNYRWPDIRWKSFGPAAEGPCCVGFVCGAAMLFNMENMRRVGFFDEDFFLYYEDEDLSRRAFDARAPMLILPHIQLTHLSRGSVKGNQPLRSEYLRGYHHAQSKLRFEKKYFRSQALLRWKTFCLALLLLPFRVLLPRPKYLARLIGRIFGLLKYQ